MDGFQWFFIKLNHASYCGIPILENPRRYEPVLKVMQMLQQFSQLPDFNMCDVGRAAASTTCKNDREKILLQIDGIYVELGIFFLKIFRLPSGYLT